MAISQAIIDDIKDQSSNLVAQDGAKDQNNQDALDAYLMDWGDAPSEEGVKLTISPTARNAIIGANRLLAASEPIPTVRNRLDTLNNGANDKVEQALRMMWKQSGMITGSEIHLDAALSSLLFGEVHLAISLTSEMAKRMAGAKGKASKRMGERLTARTPILFKCLNPRLGHFRMGPGGVSAYYRREKITRGSLRLNFPTILPGDDNKRVTLNEWWDLVYHVIWTDDQDEPLLAEEHNLPFIPVAITSVDGSSLFDRPEYNVQPFLYTYLKSGVYSRESLMLTVMYTKLFQYGMTPPLIVEGGAGAETMRFDFDSPLPVGYAPPGTRVSYPQANIIDPNVYRALEVARSLGEQSTIYQQALGAPLEGGNNPFSSVALLSQAGRLPLSGPQKALSRCVAEAMSMAMEWLKEEGAGNHPLLEDVDLETEYDIDVKIDVKTPQDTLRNAQIGAQITTGPNAFLPKSWWWENAMGINDTDEMRQKIATEQAYAATFAMQLQTQMQQLQQQMMMQQQQMAPQMGGQPGQMPPGQPGQPQQMPADQQMPSGQMPQGMPGPDGAMQMPMDPRGQMGAQMTQGQAGDPMAAMGGMMGGPNG